MDCKCYAKPSSPSVQTCGYTDEYKNLIPCDDNNCRDGKGCLPGYKPERYYGEDFLGIQEVNETKSPKISFRILTIILVILISLSTLSLFVG